MIARVLINLIRVGFLYVDYSSLLLFLSGETYLTGQNTIKIRKLLFYYKAIFLFLSIFTSTLKIIQYFFLITKYLHFHS